MPEKDNTGGMAETPEDRLLALIKMLRFGTVVITVRDGRPVEFRTELSGHLTRPLWPSQLTLIAKSQEPVAE